MSGLWCVSSLLLCGLGGELADWLQQDDPDNAPDLVIAGESN